MTSISRKTRRIVGSLILFKATYIVLLSAALLSWPTFKRDDIFHSAWANWTPEGYLTFGSHFGTWDAEHYLFLSREGYKSGLGVCAFYPLYPLLIRWVSAATGGHDILTGMVVANLFSSAAFLLFFRMVARRYGEKVALLALALLLAFPGSLFYQFIYTESLFLLLLILFCFALEREHRPLALVTGFLLPLTRAVGIFCVFPLLWLMFFRSPPAWLVALANRKTWAGRIARFVGPRVGDSPVLSSARWRGAGAVWLVLAPLMGWAAYFLLMQKWTGNAFEGIEAQKKFGVQSIHHLFDPVGFVTQLFNPTQWHGFRGSVLDRCGFILVIYCLPLIWKLDKSWCLWAFFLGVVPAVSGGFASYTRFASVVFPLFVALAVFLSKPGRRWTCWLVLTTFVTLHLILVWRFVNYRWAG